MKKKETKRKKNKTKLKSMLSVLSCETKLIHENIWTIPPGILIFHILFPLWSSLTLYADFHMWIWRWIGHDYCAAFRMHSVHSMHKMRWCFNHSLSKSFLFYRVKFSFSKLSVWKVWHKDIKSYFRYNACRFNRWKFCGMQNENILTQKKKKRQEKKLNIMSFELLCWIKRAKQSMIEAILMAATSKSISRLYWSLNSKT